MTELETHRAALLSRSASDRLRYVVDVFGAERVVLSSSLGVEDQVLTHLLAELVERPRIVTLDTGRLFPETYELLDRTRDRYGLRIEVLTPAAGELGPLLTEHGPNLFLTSVELRKACCDVRKVRPLDRALAGATAWITGLRRAQGTGRAEAEVVSVDAARNSLRVAPLFDWDDETLWAFVREHRVPTNKLHERGFPSIGCAPCTRAVRPGEDPRAGRWWWEGADHKECGIHRPSGGNS